ncbi:MAG: hypothetical protein LBC93_01425 [Synergistaceae bacterium]|nr:hypothetical protein [Synergistaceae bacterium]
MSETRVFKCVECDHTFSQDVSRLSLRCPECRGKTLILVEGPPLKSSKGCGGNCGSCGCSCH